jgi:hypothetical protein
MESHASLLAYDIKPFLQGGLPGIARLKLVLGSIVSYHRLLQHDIDNATLVELLEQAGLITYIDKDGHVSFELPDTPDCIAVSG